VDQPKWKIASSTHVKEVLGLGSSHFPGMSGWFISGQDSPYYTIYNVLQRSLAIRTTVKFSGHAT